MPWDAHSFAKHNSHLSPPQAAHAARIANAILKRGEPEGIAIATANKHFQRRDAGGGIDPTQGGIGGPTPSAQTMNPLTQGMIQRYAALPTEKLQELAARMGGSPQGAVIRQVLQRKLIQPTQQLAPQQSPAQSGAPATINPAAAGQAGLQMMSAPQPPMWRGGPVRRALGGGFAPMDPYTQQAIQQQPVPSSQIAQIQQMQGRVQPPQLQGPPGQTFPTPTAASAQRRGGSIPKREMGGDMGISPSQGSPWWTRSEARGADQSMPGGGFLAGTTGGRADAIATTAPGGSHVLPADVVAGLGDGNSLAGARVMDEILRSGPHGTPPVRGGRGMGPPRPPSPQRGEFARAGGVHGDDGGHTPVKLSHGEIVISPEHVRMIGGGDEKKGHEAIDRLILAVRKRYIQKLRSLPPPVGHRGKAA
jgi:hypothetical protein